MQERPRIDVCLGTYNGAVHLPELLKSLADQKDVNVNLLVSDDGSTDNTITVLEANAHLFNSMSISAGPKTGPADNFFFLLAKSKSRYIAFADQDDIWKEDHLIESINRIEEFANVPTLTFSKVLEFQNDDVEKNKLWPKITANLRLESWFFENKARGCTIVMNERARELILSRPHMDSIMHDWWSALVLLTCGKVVVGEKPELLYRRHERSFTGAGRRFTHRYSLKKVTQILGGWEIINQLNSLYFEFGDLMSRSAIKTVTTQINYFKKPRLFRILLFWTIRSRLRSSLLDEVLVRIRITICARR